MIVFASLSFFCQHDGFSFVAVQ